MPAATTSGALMFCGVMRCGGDPMVDATKCNGWVGVDRSEGIVVDMSLMGCRVCHKVLD